MPYNEAIQAYWDTRFRQHRDAERQITPVAARRIQLIRDRVSMLPPWCRNEFNELSVEVLEATKAIVEFHNDLQALGHQIPWRNHHNRRTP